MANNFDFMLPFSVDFDRTNGLSQKGESTKRMLSQMKGMFCDSDAYDKAMAEGDRLVYEFYELGCPEEAGQLAFGTSITYPGKVGAEYNMTKGQFSYHSCNGRGLLLLVR